MSQAETTRTDGRNVLSRSADKLAVQSRKKRPGKEARSITVTSSGRIKLVNGKAVVIPATHSRG